MSNTPEGAVKDKIKAILRTYKPHIYYFMPAMGAFGKSGVPDIIACVRGTFVAIEVKSDKNKNPPTALQEMNLYEISEAGGISLVIDKHNVASLAPLFDTLIERGSI